MAEVAGDGARLVPVGDANALAASLVDVIDSSETDRASWRLVRDCARFSRGRPALINISSRTPRRWT